MDIQKEHFLDNAKKHLAARVKVSGGQVYVGQDLNKVLIHAEDEAKQMGDEYVSVEHLFLALLKYPNKAMKEIFKEYGITRDRFYRHSQPCAATSVLFRTIRKLLMILLKNTVTIW